MQIEFINPIKDKEGNFRIYLIPFKILYKPSHKWYYGVQSTKLKIILFNIKLW